MVHLLRLGRLKYRLMSILRELDNCPEIQSYSQNQVFGLGRFFKFMHLYNLVKFLDYVIHKYYFVLKVGLISSRHRQFQLQKNAGQNV